MFTSAASAAAAARATKAKARENVDLFSKSMSVALCTAVLVSNTLLATFYLLDYFPTPTLLASNIFLLLAPIGPCASLLLFKLHNVTREQVPALHLASALGATCWYLWMLLSGRTWFLPSAVALNLFVFLHHRMGVLLLTITAIFATLIRFSVDQTRHHQNGNGFVEEIVLGVIFVLASLSGATGGSDTAIPLLLGASRLQAEPQRGFFTLSLDDMNTAEALEEIACAKRNKPGIWERVDYLRLTDEMMETLQMESQIGVGSFGNIYRAAMGQQVLAVKRIKTVKREFIESMLNEVDLLSECHHPNIIQLLGWCDNPFVLVCFELANGGNAHDFLLRAQLPVGWCSVKTKMAMDSASALAFLHNRDVLHRDVKSENLLVFFNGNNSVTVKLCDFGCAIRRKELAAQQQQQQLMQQHNQQQHGQLVGSTLWHAPELEREGAQAFDFATDVWAFGATLCEIATHVPPWEDLLTGESHKTGAAATAAMSGAHDATPVDQVRLVASQFTNIHVYERITAIMDRCCCALERGDRPSMNTVLFDLMQLYVAGDGDDGDANGGDAQSVHLGSGGGYGMAGAASGEAHDAFHALSNTAVDISPQYSPLFLRANHHKRISDPTYSGGAHLTGGRSKRGGDLRSPYAAAAAAARTPPIRPINFNIMASGGSRPSPVAGPGTPSSATKSVSFLKH